MQFELRKDGSEPPTLNFVLIPGAGFGGWVWRDVVRLLQNQGHRVLTPTLAGVAECQHLISDEVGLSSHAREIVAAVVDNNLDNVVLVGWSYGGAVAAASIPELYSRVRSAIFLDAFLPIDSRPLLEYLPTALQAQLTTWQREGSELTITLGNAAWFGLRDPILHSEVEERLSPHPGRPFFEPLTPLDLSRNVAYSYIRCTQFPFPAFDKAVHLAQNTGVFTVQYLDSGHLSMLTHPSLLAQTLMELGSGYREVDQCQRLQR
ncbi:alpha/beta hydrolase [Pseudomonas syringae pv. syringae]|uniref:alpha/beta fold hydrolase n=1 Tax=Pseudomonas syringae TaxID=317 RepID=UPI002E7ABCE6|nr:alpha/beta hydrolase [Pseudomonas syringae]MEE1993238.1 alpha/beta hydrolase [Pseudomonas syringae pv. syringae]MEE1998532.1 alpha/beta hydrolase [Pseudomonas syringae pv. syringae]